MIADDRSHAFELMLAELESSQLEVQLVPARREANVGAMVRVAVMRNCTWYRCYCARHASSRFRRNAAFDTRIKRRDTIALLERLASGVRSTSKYAPELERIALTYQAAELAV